MMKFVFLAILMAVGLGAHAQTSCGGRSGPCPSNGPEWDGTYAPGWEPGSVNANWGRPNNCGGRSGPCPSTGPEWDGTYAPGWEPGSDNANWGRPVACGGRSGPCPKANASVCREGRVKNVKVRTGKRGHHHTYTEYQMVCHNNEWYLD